MAAAAAAGGGTSLSEAFRESHPVQSHHIIPIDFASLNHLPDSHVWFSPDSHPSCLDNSHNSYTIPVIDMTAPNAAEQVGTACERWGMFQVTNHGVPYRVIDEAEVQARRLFALPVEQKQKALRAAARGAGYGSVPIAPFFEKLMWHEGFTIIGSPADHAQRIWPRHYQEFCDAMESYQKEMKTLSHKIMVLILEALGAVDNDQDLDQEPSLYLSEAALQLNSYPSCPNSSQAIGLAPHTDTPVLTILHQNDVDGLQVFEENTGWVQVRPVPAALVVNVGDLMHMLSNARFPSALHRAVPHQTKHRFSMAYFGMPPAEFVVEPLLSGLPCPRFRPVTVREYTNLKYKHLFTAVGSLRNI